MGKKQPRVENPLTGKKLTREQSDYVIRLRSVRSNARKALRSGNPAKRAAAAPVYAQAPKLIRTLYLQGVTK